MLDRITQILPKDHFTTKAIANEAVKIDVTEVDSYRKLVKEFRAREIKFFTYPIKADRAFKIILRNLHHSVGHEEIKEALQNEGAAVRNVINIRHARTKDPLSLSFIDLEPIGDYKKVREVKGLLQHRVTIESLRPGREIEQCTRCQQFGHTCTYCILPPV